MTRINANIPVQELTREHLLSEHREMIRVPNAITKGRARINNIPSTFRLGKGHVKFFYDKHEFLLRRYKQVYTECKNRGYNVQNYESCWDGVPKHLFNDYAFTEAENNIVRERINERLNK